MKKITALSLILCTIVCIFSGCGANIYFKDKYDKDKYAINSDIDTVRFIVPKDIENAKKSNSELSDKINNDKNTDNDVLYFTDKISAKYYKPAKFYMEVLRVKIDKNIEEFDDINKTSDYLSNDIYLKFSKYNKDSGIEKKTSGKKTRILFQCKIKDETISQDYYGYVGMIQDSEQELSYAIIVGYGDKNHNEIAKELAENIYFVE